MNPLDLIKNLTAPLTAPPKAEAASAHAGASSGESFSGVLHDRLQKPEASKSSETSPSNEASAESKPASVANAESEPATAPAVAHKPRAHRVSEAASEGCQQRQQNVAVDADALETEADVSLDAAFEAAGLPVAVNMPDVVSADVSLEANLLMNGLVVVPPVSTEAPAEPGAAADAAIPGSGNALSDFCRQQQGAQSYEAQPVAQGVRLPLMSSLLVSNVPTPGMTSGADLKGSDAPEAAEAFAVADGVSLPLSSDAEPSASGVTGFSVPVDESVDVSPLAMTVPSDVEITSERAGGTSQQLQQPQQSQPAPVPANVVSTEVASALSFMTAAGPDGPKQASANAPSTDGSLAVEAAVSFKSAPVSFASASSFNASSGASSEQGAADDGAVEGSDLPHPVESRSESFAVDLNALGIVDSAAPVSASSVSRADVQPVAVFRSAADGVPAQIADAIQVSLRQDPSGQRELTMQLNPHDLGSVRIKLTSVMQDGVSQMSARFIVSTPEALDKVSAQLNQLKHSLEAQGVSLHSTQVVMAGDAGTQNNLSGQNTPGDSQSQQQLFQQNSQQQQEFAREQYRQFHESASGFKSGGGQPAAPGGSVNGDGAVAVQAGSSQGREVGGWNDHGSISLLV